MNIKKSIIITITIVVMGGGAAYLRLNPPVIYTAPTVEQTPADNQIQPTSIILPTRVGPPDIYPDETRTPGALNPHITQDTIKDTICNPSWSTKSIRPSVSYTTPLKVKQIGEYGYTDTNTKDYEEDHLIPLELGGSPTDPKNLWPEPYTASIPDGGAKSKDTVENYLHKEVCAGVLSLSQAQFEISHDWYAVLKSIK